MFAQIDDDVPQFMRIRSGRENTVLGTLELGGRDHFHRFGDLLGIFDGSNLPSQTL